MTVTGRLKRLRHFNSEKHMTRPEPTSGRIKVRFRLLVTVLSCDTGNPGHAGRSEVTGREVLEFCGLLLCIVSQIAPAGRAYIY